MNIVETQFDMRVTWIAVLASILVAVLLLGFHPRTAVRYRRIPKFIWTSTPSRRNIPRIIHQTFKTTYVPETMYEATQSWVRLNPNYDYRFYDDDDILERVRSFDCSSCGFSSEDLQRAYERIIPGAGKADIFRYLITYLHGGCYFDVDCTCKRALDSFVRPEDDLVSGLGERGDLHQWGLVYRARHPFMRKALELSVQLVLDGRFMPGYENSLEGLTGPPVLDAAIKSSLGLPPQHRFVSGTYELSGHRFNVLSGDLFDGAVDFKYPEYKEDLRSMQVTYWQHSALLR